MGDGDPASASIAVVAPPAITKSFGPTSIALGGTASMSFTVVNPNPDQNLDSVAFTDSLPPGLVVATAPNVVTNCSGPAGFITANAGTSLILVGPASIAANSSCQISVDVTGATLGVKNNVTSPVSSFQGGTGNTASASLTVGGVPILSKEFVRSTIPLGGSTALTFTLVNFNAAPLTGAAFSDPLPGGLVVGSPNGLSNSCGGTVTAAPGSSTIGLTGGTIPASSNCVVSVNVRGTSAGFWSNLTSPLTTAEGLNGFPATASVTVVAPPSLSKAFGPSTVQVGTTTTLTFRLTNPNPDTPLTRITFADPFPPGLMVAATPAVSNNCGGVPSVGPFALAVAYANASLPGGGSCTFSVNVTATSPGVKNNTTTIISSAQGGTGNPATATLTVIP